MREIKFRGKRFDNGEWVCGGSVIQFVDDGVLTVYIPQFNEKCTCLHDAQDNIMAFEACSIYKVNPATVGQHTGLKDKTGREIYEGDILHCQDRIVHVRWHAQAGTWDCDFVKYTDNPLCSNGIIPVEWKFRAEIIGNVHDNPELL